MADETRSGEVQSALSGSDATRALPVEVEQAIRATTTAESADQAALTLAAIANRAIAELNKLARAEANARRGQAEWGAWASMANAARDAVLKVATCRKVASDLARKAAGG
jgi:hypothetical protein